MSKRRRQPLYTEDINIWASFTDLMSNAFMIMSLLLLLILIKPLLNKSGLVNPEIPKEAPPIIIIQDTGAYQFTSGSADIPPALSDFITQNLVTKIAANAQEYQINTIEIIGHTDGQANGATVSNLDQNLELVASGQVPFNKLTAGSNADLGLMRALAVMNLLQSIPSLKNLEFRAYSAAQLVSPQGGLAPINRGSDSSRRRIEIRFTRLGKVESIR
ncbi:outer membrane protein/peptidoglycan-associated (lipo)protein [Synechococcus sp. PCC 7502]|uniref:hypothetical protein n=1 Tax=Synechococcus sp. PCC 7502 TaxID=1173263 RepID=UPI00029FFB60|nr:hypothetical protein [Synechococcus sp. PCC 7502]AFY72693.1 outer membrane protein/peptidoglycan-associated (lipo)protein [Synechococcus sp. PCC 7502]